MVKLCHCQRDEVKRKAADHVYGMERFIFATVHVAPEGDLTPWMDDRQAIGKSYCLTVVIAPVRENSWPDSDVKTCTPDA
jgi:hypothetical protein